MNVDLLSISPCISRIVPTDRDIFIRYFNIEKTCYSNSWLYILRAARFIDGSYGFKYSDDHTLFSIGYRKNAFFIVHPMGEHIVEKVSEICKAIRSQSDEYIIIKKVDASLEDEFTKTGLFAKPEDKFPLLEEESFPETILTLHLTASDSSSIDRIRNYKRKIKRFEKLNMAFKKQPLYDRKISQNELETICRGNSDMVQSYQGIIEAVSTTNSETSTISRVYTDEKDCIHGIYVCDKLSSNEAGLYCGVTSKQFPGISEWMDNDFFTELCALKIKTLFLGGAEKQGVDTYIKKLSPLKPNYTTKLILYK